MTAFHLTPNKLEDWDSRLECLLEIFNSIVVPGETLKNQYEKSATLMNWHLGAVPAPDYLSYQNMRKYSGVELYIGAWSDLSGKQIEITFKVRKQSTSSKNMIEVYQNGYREDETQQLIPGDDQFILLLRGDEPSETYLFFRNASGWPYFWFKEIIVKVLD